jgi:Ca2+-dependent lipid-binding protein
VHKAGLESDGLGERGGEAEKDYLVQVTLVSGHGLAVRDRTGTSDPYVKFKCGQFKYRSMVVNRNLNPEWNEAFSFITSQLSAPLEVKVYDHDFGSIDDYMGGAIVSLDYHAHGE